MLIKLCILCIFVLLVGVLGEMDRQDAELQQRHYCEMTNAKLWAQFKTNVNCDEIVGEDYER